LDFPRVPVSLMAGGETVQSGQSEAAHLNNQ